MTVHQALEMLLLTSILGSTLGIGVRLAQERIYWLYWIAGYIIMVAYVILGPLFPFFVAAKIKKALREKELDVPIWMAVLAVPYSLVHYYLVLVATFDGPIIEALKKETRQISLQKVKRKKKIRITNSTNQTAIKRARVALFSTGDRQVEAFLHKLAHA